MYLLKTVFTKIDNGSISEWSSWDYKSIAKNSMFSVGQIFCKVVREKGAWRITYKMEYDDHLELPRLFKVLYKTKDEVKTGLDKFVEWAYDNQIRLIEAHERGCG